MTSTGTENWTLPPIGTTDNPFIGNFDGKGYTISNLVVDNELGDGHITRKPSTVSSITGVNIVGTFGVVGPYTGFDTTTYTYSSSVNVVKNVYLANTEVKSQLPETLIGIAAGYVNASVTDFGIIAPKLTINSGTAPLTGGPTAHISDYSTVGYATTDYKKYFNKTATTVKTPTTSTAEFTYEAGGASSGWGGSIDMAKLYKRLLGYFNAATEIKMPKTQNISITADGVSTVNSETDYGTFRHYAPTGTTTIQVEGKNVKYNNELKGTYSFSLHSEGLTDYMYLYGKKDFTNSKTVTKATYNDEIGYFISSDSNYLVPDGTTGVTGSTTTPTTPWTFSNPGATGTISMIISGTTYYLSVSSAPSGNYVGYLSLSTTPRDWTQTSEDLTTTYNGSTVYLIYLSDYSSWYNYSSHYSTTTITQTRGTTTTTSTTQETNSTLDTIVPLNVDGNGYPKNSNTGYIVSGATYDSGYSYYQSGDIRVSRYEMTDLNRSLGSDTVYTFRDNTFEVLTKNAKTNNKFVAISDSHNNGQTTNVNSYLSTYVNNQMTVSELGFQKYDKSRKAFGDVLSDATDSTTYNNYTVTNLYGLHFMNASISKDNVATASVATVRLAGDEREVPSQTNFKMPRDSIDFNLQKKGYINFFSGTYFSGNNSFFSLHKITRTTGNEISTIKEISKIYGKTSDETKDFVYLYADNSYSDSTLNSTKKLTNAGYVLVFDTSWIKTQTIVKNACYYFEIPANSGEYCLGSVSGGTGAYLLYLDISANAQAINRTIVTEDITSVTKVYEYPLGVALITAVTSPSHETVNPLASVAIALNSGYSGTLSLSKADTTVTMTSASDSFTAGFKGDSIALARSGSTDPPTITPYSSSTDEIKRLTYIDYNTSTTSTSYVIITDTNGTKTCTDATGKAITSYQANDGSQVTFGSGVVVDTSGLTTDLLVYSYGYSVSKDTITATFVFTHAQDASNTTLHVDKVTGYTITVKSTSEAVNITVTVKDGNYVITINGTTITVGTVVAVPVTTA